MLLTGDQPVLAALRSQAKRSTVVSREYTGVGFFCHFAVSEETPSLPQTANFELGDVSAEIKGLAQGAGFVLFVRNGRMVTLEGFSYDEPWPEVADDFVLSYWIEPRTFSPRAKL
jgi:hypothetical protein